MPDFSGYPDDFRADRCPAFALHREPTGDEAAAYAAFERIERLRMQLQSAIEAAPEVVADYYSKIAWEIDGREMTGEEMEDAVAKYARLWS
jgi:hypothetical protein